jgi:hypothetical protein
VAGPAAQRRATVAVRLILVIPHYVVLYVLGIAASVIVVIGWFGALFTGRVPAFAHTFLSGYLRWYCRIAAYLLLLTDEYPPFTYDDTAYPVRLAVGPGKMSRLTVLFRGILAIPAWIAAALVSFGVSSLVIFIAWLIALFAGRLPESLHQALAAVLRYVTRYYCYLYLLTDVYPAGLFGDQPGTQAAPPPPAGGPGYGMPGGPGYGMPGGPGYGTPQSGYGAPVAGYGTSGYGAPAGYGAQGYGAPGGYGTPGYETGYGAPAAGYGSPGYAPPGYGAPGPWAQPADVPGPEVNWQLVLSAGAKRLVVLFLVLGLLGAAGEGALIGTAINAAVQRDREINQLNADITRHNSAVAQLNGVVAREEQAAYLVNGAISSISDANGTMNDTYNSPAANSANCSTVACFDQTAVPVADGLATFGRVLRGVAVPAGSAAIQKRLVADTAALEQNWREQSQAGSFASVEDISTAGEAIGGRWDNDYSALLASLNNQATAVDEQESRLVDQASTLNQGATALERRAAALGVTVTVQTANEP